MFLVPPPREPLVDPGGYVSRTWWRFFQQLGGGGVAQTTLLFKPIVLTMAAASIYTVDATPSTIALSGGRVRFTNTTGSSHTVTAYGVPSGGTPSAGNCFAFQEAVAANSHLDIDLPVLGPGGFFQALADANTAITVHFLRGVLSS